VDVSSKEREVADRLEKERDALKDRSNPVSRTHSRTASERSPASRTQTPPLPVSPPLHASPRSAPAPLTANVRPSLSFANVASTKKDNARPKEENEVQNPVVHVAEVPAI
jgi:translation initiation factor 4B